MPADPAGTDLYISAGTWSLVGFESDTPVLGTEALAARISNERTGDGRYRPLTNVIGLWRAKREGPRVPDYRRIVALSLTEASLGNGLGIGMADFTTKRFVDAYVNVVTTDIVGIALDRI